MNPKKSITLRIDESVYDQLVIVASAENRSVANLVETWVLRQLTDNCFLDLAKKTATDCS